jgi:membrane associated rhomboid family serine protease
MRCCSLSFPPPLRSALFWTLAFLSALIEPLSQAPLAGAEPGLVWALFGFIVLFNLSEAALWRRFGWPAPILSRLAFYAIWHVVFGPVLSGTLWRRGAGEFLFCSKAASLPA